MTGTRNAAKGKGKAKKQMKDASSTIPDIYNDMLAEALPAQHDLSNRPLKRRKTGSTRTEAVNAKIGKLEGNRLDGEDEDAEDDEDHVEFEEVELEDTERLRQTAYRSEDDDSEDSDVEWKPLDLDAYQYEEPVEDLELTLTEHHTPKQRAAPRRKAVTNDDRLFRLERHKLHVLCLLSHTARRNEWCNDVEVHNTLKALLDKKMITFLNPTSKLSQFGRTESLKRGLEMVSMMWKKRYSITARGLRRALWADDPEDVHNYHPPEDHDAVYEIEDFRNAAFRLEGSRDIGAQLFCALLRTAGADARLICSLQPLSFVIGGPSMAKPSTPNKKITTTEIIESPSSNAPSPDQSSNPRRRLGHPLAAGYLIPHMQITAPNPPKPKRNLIVESPFPVYWVEVLDEAHSKWLPMDPENPESVAKPRSFEPPASDRENNMTYVIGFEDDGSGKDVTRRYAKAYNAKTRKNRVEISSGGKKWWKKTMRHFSKEWPTDVDEIEDTELTAIEEREPMPKNIVDFKDHPTYALERHLKRNEVLVRTQEIGKVPAGKDSRLPGGKKMESVYRRKDVKLVKSADAWYRLGRDVKFGEQPIKIAPPKSKPGDEDGEDDRAATNLYSIDQTELYRPPPCVAGRVPKNSFGNLDLFVPSMIPEGGVHIPDVQAVRAARTLGIDFSEALVGFDFRGRHGTAVLKGVVVAIEYREAMEAIIMGFRDEMIREAEERRSHAALKKWRHFMMSLRIKKRIDGYQVDGEDEAEAAGEYFSEAEEGPEDEVESDEDYGGGGFFPE